MKRRRFVQTSIAVASAPILFKGCQSSQSTSESANKKIKGFIFSDAHIGWKSQAQPSLDTQKNAIQIIKNHFGALDLVFDTGDFHHGNLPNDEKVAAQDFWLKEMAGQFPRSLFHYVPGNHELARGTDDVELRVAQVGSFAWRPYYSFDYKGIHFISLPQLQDTILITRETMNWLAKDLEMNKHKTTLVFSHNSIKGTTHDGNATVYRVTVNSDEVLNLLNKHGNVLAWFHGHNHQYEIVKKAQRLYVSNGRIGGFNPPETWGDFGQGHLGGVYFEIDASGLTVKCFSATENDFFENLGKRHLSNSIQRQTSITSNTNVNYYWGHGMLYGQNTFLFNNHYPTNKRSEAYLSHNATTAINTNHDLRFGTQYSHLDDTRNKIIGYHLKPRSVQYSKTDQGIKIEPVDDQPFFINLPVEKYLFDKYLSRSGYYRCGLGDQYALKITFEPELGDVHLSYKVMDLHHNVCFQQDQWLSGTTQDNSVLFDIQVPEQLDVEPTDHRIYLFVSLRFDNNPTSFYLKEINLHPKTNADVTEDSLSIAGEVIESIDTRHQLTLNNASVDIKTNDFITPKTLYVKSPDVQWQVRNATASMHEDGLTIDRLRYEFSQHNHVIITPTNARKHYVNELINISSCRISYVHKQVRIENIKMASNAALILVSDQTPSQVSGAEWMQVDASSYRLNVLQTTVALAFDA